MDFLLRTEIEAKRNNFCPNCYKTQIKKLDTTKLYTKYMCWNKACEKKNIPFIIINDRITNEDFFEQICESCQTPFTREFKVNDNHTIDLIFKCEGKMCESHLEPFRYSLSSNKWEGKTPKFTIYEDKLDFIQNKQEKRKSKPKSYREREKLEEIDKNNINRPLEKLEPQNSFCKIGEIPLLTMNGDEYDKFMAHHDNKVVILVDVPNLVRTLREFHPSGFEQVLKKAHNLLLKSIENLFYTTDECIIRYFSKPDDDLKSSNDILTDFCVKNRNTEYFHLLKLGKGLRYSDIDNYLIANGVEILERCKLKGFVIISSDKDYLPVMRIAGYKKVRAYIMGVNTPEIYENYNIGDIKFLGILKFFKN